MTSIQTANGVSYSGSTIMTDKEAKAYKKNYLANTPLRPTTYFYSLTKDQIVSSVKVDWEFERTDLSKYLKKKGIKGWNANLICSFSILYKTIYHKLQNLLDEKIQNEWRREDFNQYFSMSSKNKREIIYETALELVEDEYENLFAQFIYAGMKPSDDNYWILCITAWITVEWDDSIFEMYSPE